MDLLKVAASPCTWLHGCGPAAPRLKKAAPPQRVLDGAPRPRDAAMAGPGPDGTAGSSSGRRAGADKCDSLHKAAAAAAAAAPASDVPAELHAGGPLTDDDGAPRRRSTESGERNTERERERDPAPPPPGGGLSRWRSLRGELPGELDWALSPCCRVGASCVHSAPGRRSVPRPSPRREVAWSPHARRRRLGTCKLTTCLG